MTLIEDSEKLHTRVRALARAFVDRRPLPEPFDEVAVDIARYQASLVPGLRRLIEARGRPLVDAASIPAVPVDAFRLTRVASHPPELDAARFVTSGTTGGAVGVHPLRTTRTYRELSLAWGTPALSAGGSGPRVAIALAPDPGSPGTSSLGFMMRAMMDAWGGRPRGSDSGPPLDDSERWLAAPGGIDVDGLRRAARRAHELGQPLLVLATSFALVLLIDALPGSIEAPEHSVVMVTGGFKGRSREVEAADLLRETARAFGIPESHVVGEYGMTELTSQLYEGTLPDGELRAPRGVFLPPPWLSVTPVDPETLEPVKAAEIGIARFVDLGNVDSTVAIVTQDRVRRSGAGIELHGRSPGAPPRGCALAIEEMVLGAGPP